MRRWPAAAAVMCLWATVAHAQFALFSPSCESGQAVGSLFSFGSIDPGQAASVTFCLLNATSETQTVTELSVAGTGFSPPNAAAPMSLNAGASVNFTVTFEAATPAYYNGSLNITGISVLLTAVVTPALTYEVQLPSGTVALGSSPVDFGSVQLGATATLGFLAVNQTASTLTVGAISVGAGDFALVGPSPSGTALGPEYSATFTVQFSPTVPGARTATLSIGSLQFTLTGTGAPLPLPQPVLSVTLGEAESAQQGSVSVSFNAPAEAAGSGTVTLLFQAETPGALDPGIVFGAGGEVVPFTFNQGDSAANFAGAASAPFQTGTTAGTLTFDAQIGSSTSQQNVVIAPATIAVTAVSGDRGTSSLTVNVTGFDNTRTAGQLSFTFYDSAGNTIPPGAVTVDSTATFSSYFAGSADGGQFALSAYFPVTGDPSQVIAFTAQLTNSIGTVTTPRTLF